MYVCIYICIIILTIIVTTFLTIYNKNQFCDQTHGDLKKYKSKYFTCKKYIN